MAVLAAVSCSMIGGPLVSMTVFIPVLEQAEGWSDTALGGAASALLVSLSLASLLSGVLCDRFNVRLPILCGGLLAAGGCLAAARCTYSEGFVGAYFVIGMGLGLATIVPSISLLSRIFPDRRGLALGLYFSSLALISAASPSISGWLATEWSWRVAMALMGMVIALTLPLLSLVKEPEREGRDMSVASQSGLSMPRALLLPQYWILLGLMTLALVNAQGVLFTVVSFLVQGGMALQKATVIYGVANFCAAPAMVLAGIAADRWGVRKVLACAAVLQGIGTLALLGTGAPAAISYLAVALFCLCWGMTSGVASQLGPVLLEDVVGERHFGALLGINHTTTGLLGAMSPVGAALMREAGFSQALIFQYLAVACLLVAPLVCLVSSRAGDEPDIAR